MAELQGNLNLIPLPDVLKLLADKASSGVLSVQGESNGWIYLEDGKVRYATTRQDDPAKESEQVREHIISVLVRIARFEQGEFSFSGGDVEESPGEQSFEIGPLVDEADHQVAEWREIESLIPSVATELTMTTDVTDEATITLGGRSWRVLASLATEGTIRDVATSLGVFEIDAARSLAQMVRDGLLEVGDEAQSPDTRYAAGGRIFETESAEPPEISAPQEKPASLAPEETANGLADAAADEPDEDDLMTRWREMRAAGGRG